MLRRNFVRASLLALGTPAIGWAARAGESIAAGARQAPDVSALTGAGRRVTLSGRSITELASSLHGGLLLPDSAGYDEARQILNPSFDRHPALIVQPSGVADIRRAVDFARDNDGLLLAVKCGGHSASGQSTCDGGMMIDLSQFRDVRIDPRARRAWISGGSLLGQLDHESLAFGLATTMGTVSHTGAGGLITGGGFGRLGRRLGLSIDNLVAVDVVTADGELRHASAEHNPDLFWGVRGGGGNFGIVTSFELQLHPQQRKVLAGRLAFPLARARDMLELFAETAQRGSEDLDIGFVLVHPAGGAPGAAVLEVCYSGPESGAERALAGVRRLGAPMRGELQGMDYVEVQRSGDSSDPRALGSYLKSGFVEDIPAGLASAVIDRLEPHPARHTLVFAQISGGAIARVAPDATAFAQRAAIGNLMASVAWKHGDDPAPHIGWIKQFWTGIEPYTTGFYTNDLAADESAEAIGKTFRANHARLVEVKNRYDPGNLFRLNANVQPTV